MNFDADQFCANKAGGYRHDIMQQLDDIPLCDNGTCE
jgi:hypothetical protein